MARVAEEGVKNEAHLWGMGATSRVGRLREGLERVTVYSHHLPDANRKAKQNQELKTNCLCCQGQASDLDVNVGRKWMLYRALKTMTSVEKRPALTLDSTAECHYTKKRGDVEGCNFSLWLISFFSC